MDKGPDVPDESWITAFKNIQKNHNNFCYARGCAIYFISL